MKKETLSNKSGLNKNFKKKGTIRLSKIKYEEKVIQVKRVT